jgi:glycosyltransferase involved in cell wall biosynthesis
MKILFIHTFYSPHNAGGAENSLRVLVEAMRDKGHEALVLATCDKKGLHKEIVNGIKVYRGGIKNRYWLYRNTHQHSKFSKLLWHIKDMYNTGMKDYVKEVISIEKPDIVSCHNLAGWSIAVWDEIRRAKIPIVQVLHDFYFLCTKSTLFKDDKPCAKRCIECKLMRIFHKKKSRNIDAVVGVCQDVVDRITNAGYFANSLKTAIHNVRVIPDIAKQSCPEGSEIVFGFIGTLTPSKGVPWLIEQFKKVNSANVSLKIAGKGDISYEQSLKNQAKDDERISFLGYTQSELFYSQVDILIIPSIWYEPLASVAIEACAHHIPVITSAAGGLKEIIKDGYNGLHCDISNPDSLSNAMEKLVNDRLLLNTLQNEARESVSSFLDIHRLTCEYETIYKQIVSNYF